MVRSVTLVWHLFLQILTADVFEREFIFKPMKSLDPTERKKQI